MVLQNFVGDENQQSDISISGDHTRTSDVVTSAAGLAAISRSDVVQSVAAACQNAVPEHGSTLEVTRP
jgi:hypothetical protein